ncbi:MAG: EFR1 family ferrodoxin [Promethearchaeia archaeon]
MKIALIYFSPTGNTKKIAEKIRTTLLELEADIFEFDITSYQDRKDRIRFSRFNACFFGFPVHGWRVPKILREWFKTIKGSGLKCSTFITYGGINPGIVHYDIQQILNRQEFHLFSTAEFLGRHTFNLAGWEVAVNRPNTSDFHVAEQYTRLTYRKFHSKNSALDPFSKPHISNKKLKKIENRPRKFVPPPKINKEICKQCGVCNEKCPNAAIDLQTQSINQSDCIRCLRCVKYCPEDAVTLPDLSHIFKNLKKIENISTKAKSKYFI